jgi:NADPH:quinone reductase-like Zn-dependent oxidoreductase
LYHGWWVLAVRSHSAVAPVASLPHLCYKVLVILATRSFPYVHFWRRAARVYFYSMYNHVMDPAQLARGKAMVYGGIASGHLRPIIDSVFPFDCYLDAYRHMLSNTQRGKIVVKVR